MVGKNLSEGKSQKQEKNGMLISVFNTTVEIPAHAIRYNSETRGIFFRKGNGIIFW